MRHNIQYSSTQKQPILLCEDEIKQPEKVFAHFFDCYHLPEIREQLWDYITGLMGSREADDFSWMDRINAMTFYRELETFLEAAWLLHQKKKTKKKSTKN